MKCPKCQFENPKSAKFCVECGGKLEIICPSCGFSNSSSFKFCGECGHNLTVPSEPTPKDLSFDEKIDKIQRYLPKGLTEKILGQRDKIEGERKQVTVMFCDMEGFTPLVEKLGPEEAYGIMDQVYEILIHKVHDYGGTVNEMTGDGIMALFGAPIALEDVPQRAIRSAIAIHREMARFSDKARQEKEKVPSLKMRIGVHTGPVVVGTLGNNLRVEFKAVGDTVNLASRMEGLAEPGTTYVTEETFKLTEGFFRFEALGEKEVKGKKELIKVYRVIAPSTRRTRFDVSAERGLTPFVGRGRELELLLDAFERIKAGRGQAFSITAEAGVGKSRLLYEFRKAVSNEDVTFLEGKCLSYSRGVAYHPVIDILKSNYDIREGNGDSEITEKVKTGLKAIGADEVSTLPYLLELLSVKDSGIDKIPMSPEARKDRIIETLNRIVLNGSEIRPLIMAIEDLHWVDKSSEDSFKDLLDSITGARVFLIFTYRPEFVHTWGGRSYHSQVNLNRLSNRESLAMVSHLLGTEEIDRDLEELILEKTEGVPFFIEEFIRSLKDLNIIERKDNKYRLAKDVQDLTIPSTIQDLIMARVDSLPEGAKDLLQTGSAIEREFSYELIKRVLELPEQELLSHLSALKDSELIYERGIYPQSNYIFKHALTHDVVYGSILTKRKKHLHEEIGNAIVELYKENIDAHYSILVEHFIESENYEKGAEYSRLAGKKALKSASFTEAVAHTRKRVFCLEKLRRTEDIQRRIIDARTALANCLIPINQFHELKEAVAPIADLALKLNYQRRLPAIYTAIGIYSLWVDEDYPKGFKYLNDASKISEQIGDFLSLYFANFYLGWTHCWNCEFEKALQYLNKSLELSVLANDPIGMSFAKGVTTAGNYTFSGKIDLAYQTSKELLQIAEETGDIFIRGMAYSTRGSSCYFKGLFDEAKDYLLKGLALCEKTAQAGWKTWACFFLGHTYFELDEHMKVKEYYEEGINALGSVNMLPSWKNMAIVSLARAEALYDSQWDSISELFNELHRYYKDNNLKVCEGWIARYIGEILLNIDDQDVANAEDWIGRAIKADEKNGTRWFLANDYVLYADLFMRKGDQSRAKENLNKAIRIFRECGADGWVKKAEKELATLS
jgi:class 3 adenylate cyclase/tetratricopeptide (TPR) repeat protein